MKKTITIFVLLLLFLAPALFAQQTATITAPAELYYVNVPIDRIFAYRIGYVVEYLVGFERHRAYIPRDWFNVGPGSQGEMIILRPGRAWPSMTIFYNRGEFSHVRLRVRERSHSTWGNLPVGIDLDHLFEDVTDLLRLEF